MAFFDEIGKKISQTGQEAYSKTRDIADVVKFNSLISDEEKLLEKYYNSLGKAYYNKIIQQVDLPNEFSEIINSISNSLSKISNYNEQIKILKGIKKCNNCGSDVPSGAAFCIKCGTKVIIDSGISCKNCEAKLPKGAAFCTSCGCKADTEINNESLEILDDSVIRCSECGNVLNENDLFCTNCGRKVDVYDYEDEDSIENKLITENVSIESHEEPIQSRIYDDNECQYQNDVNIQNDSIKGDLNCSELFDDNTDIVISKSVCPNCQSPLEDEQFFCTNCGAKIENKKETELIDKQLNRCPNCDADIYEGSAFCTNCGFKLIDEED